MASRNGPTLRQELIWTRPILCRAMHFHVQNPEYSVVGRKLVASVVSDAHGWLTSTCSTCRGKEAHGFLDDSECEVKVVDDAGLLDKPRRCIGGVRAQNFIVLCTEASQDLAL